MTFSFPPDRSAIISSEFICRNPPTHSCHASTIAEVGSGDLVAAWFGGTAESHPDVKIYCSRRVNGSWETPVGVASSGAPDLSCYNPVLWKVSDGALILFYKVGKGPSSWRGMRMVSTDDGGSWGQPVRLPDGIFGPIKNRPLELDDGSLLCPSSAEMFDGRSYLWTVHVERTSDKGITWSKTSDLNDPHEIDAIQPSILPLGKHHLRAIGRTKQGHLFALDSSDNGRTWSPMRLIDVPNPNSGADAIRLNDGRFLLVYNRSKTERTPLTVAISTDAEHWGPVLDVETKPGEFSYPSVIQSKDNLIHITYTWNRTRIRHTILDPRHLK